MRMSFLDGFQILSRRTAGTSESHRFLFLLCNVLMTVQLIFVSCYAEDSVVLSLDNIEWGERAGGNGFPEGLQTYRFSEDEETGGISYYARFPAGSYYKSHWHTYDEVAILLKGSLKFVIDNVTHEVQTGTYFSIPGGHAHEWDMREQTEDIILLVQRKGPPDFHFVEQGQMNRAASSI